MRDPEKHEPVEGVETFKLFAVTGKPVRFEWLRQEAVRGGDVEERLVGERAALEDVLRAALDGRTRDVSSVRPTSPELEDWTTIELAFVLRRLDSEGGGEAKQTHPAHLTTTAALPPVQSAPPMQSARSTANTNPTQEEARPLFDPRFAKTAALTLVGVGLVVLWPLWLGAARFIIDGEVARNFSALIAIQLAVAGVAVAFGALYLALLEFRGRAQAAAELAGRTAEPGTRGLVAEAVKAAPEILKAFGQLKPVAALLAVAAFLFLCATVLAWRGLDG